MAFGLNLPDGAQREEIHPGAWKFSWQGETEGGPVVIHGFYWKVSQQELALVSSAGKGHVQGKEEVSRQAERFFSEDTAPVAAVNGDFFVMRGEGAGAVRGLFIREGELLSTGTYPTVAILDDGSLGIEKIDVRLWLETEAGERIGIDRVNQKPADDELTLYTSAWGAHPPTARSQNVVRLDGTGRLEPEGTLSLEVVSTGGAFVLASNGKASDRIAKLRKGMHVKLMTEMEPSLPVSHAVSGVPVMVRDGEVMRFDGADPEEFIPGPGDPNARHPRTAIGTDGEHVVAVAVDGRAPGISEGMTMPEMGELFRDLGCISAINLDGGGSTTAWARGQVLNQPSDGEQRPVGNALVLLSLARENVPERVEFAEGEIVRLAPGSSFAPGVTVYDRWKNPIDVPDERVTFTASETIGRVVNDRRLVAGDLPARGEFRATVGEAVGRLSIEVTDDVARMEASPSSVYLLPGDATEVDIDGFDSEGNRVRLNLEALQWDTADELGQWDGEKFHASEEPVAGSLSVHGYDQLVEIPVTVAKREVVRDFSPDQDLGDFGKIPDEVEGKLFRMADEESGAHFVRVRYSLKGTRPTRAAFLHLDRSLGRPLEAAFRVRGSGRGVLRISLRSADGGKRLLTVHEGTLPSEWTTYRVDIPNDLPHPVELENIYLASTSPDEPIDGHFDLDFIEAARIDWPERDVE